LVGYLLELPATHGLPLRLAVVTAAAVAVAPRLGDPSVCECHADEPIITYPTQKEKKEGNLQVSHVGGFVWGNNKKQSIKRKRDIRVEMKASDQHIGLSGQLGPLPNKNVEKETEH
jgi:hypothetical protein